MTDRELMQQALDALEEVNSTGYRSCWKGAFDAEIELLRARLAQPEGVKIPTSADEAELMAKLGCSWLQQYAPERLAQPYPDNFIDALRFRTAMQEPEPEPAAWLITDEMINSLQIDSIQRLIDRARHAHMTDIKLRINGQDEWYEADWLKHLKRAAPPQREWQELTDEEIHSISMLNKRHYARVIEAKLREKNT